METTVDASQFVCNLFKLLHISVIFECCLIWAIICRIASFAQITEQILLTTPGKSLPEILLRVGSLFGILATINFIQFSVLSGNLYLIRGKGSFIRIRDVVAFRATGGISRSLLRRRRRYSCGWLLRLLLPKPRALQTRLFLAGSSIARRWRDVLVSAARS